MSWMPLERHPEQRIPQIFVPSQSMHPFFRCSSCALHSLFGPMIISGLINPYGILPPGGLFTVLNLSSCNSDGCSLLVFRCVVLAH